MDYNTKTYHLPNGWIKTVVPRKNPIHSRVDVYIRTPLKGCLLRSSKDLEKFVMKHPNLLIDPSLVNFQSSCTDSVASKVTRSLYQVIRQVSGIEFLEEIVRDPSPYEVQVDRDSSFSWESTNQAQFPKVENQIKPISILPVGPSKIKVDLLIGRPVKKTIASPKITIEKLTQTTPGARVAPLVLKKKVEKVKIIPFEHKKKKAIEKVQIIPFEEKKKKAVHQVEIIPIEEKKRCTITPEMSAVLRVHLLKSKAFPSPDFISHFSRELGLSYSDLLIWLQLNWTKKPLNELNYVEERREKFLLPFQSVVIETNSYFPIA